MTAHCGFIAIVGRPNVGKSTLLNRMLGTKLSITSRRPQTTRHSILGILTREHRQAIFIDTPGLHKPRSGALNRYLNRAATSSLIDIDVVVMVVDRLLWTDEDELVLERAAAQSAPLLLVINKVDLLPDKQRLLPRLQELDASGKFAAVIPLSAHQGSNVDALLEEVFARLPEGEPVYPDDQLTDRSERFLAAEVIREKLTRLLDREIPYKLSVAIENFRSERRRVTIDAVIWVERTSQKAIVIGRDGGVLKRVGTRARLDLERMFSRQVVLHLWVRVKEHWTDDEQALARLGYVDRDG